MTITPVSAAATPAAQPRPSSAAHAFVAQPATLAPAPNPGVSTARTVSGGGLGLHLSIPIPKVLVWAGLGALAGMFVPPLAALGAVGGAIAGAAIGLLL